MNSLTIKRTENRFRLLAAKGNRKRGLEILEKLGAHFDDGELHTIHDDGQPFKRG